MARSASSNWVHISFHYLIQGQQRLSKASYVVFFRNKMYSEFQKFFTRNRIVMSNYAWHFTSTSTPGIRCATPLRYVIFIIYISGKRPISLKPCFPVFLICWKSVQMCRHFSNLIVKQKVPSIWGGCRCEQPTSNWPKLRIAFCITVSCSIFWRFNLDVLNFRTHGFLWHWRKYAN